MNEDEFYVGYEPTVPPRLARHVRAVAMAIVAMAVGVAAGWLLLQDRLVPARFDYGRPQPMEGVLRRGPYPELVSDGRGRLLVGAGKHGADAALEGVPNGPVRLAGMTIARRGVEMVEVVPGSIVPGISHDGPEARGHTAPTDSRDVTLTGEIVDSKCFLGVMNPGEGTVHRDCARMCLKGGIPPALLLRGASGEEALVLLVGADGSAIGRALADLAGVPVTVRGRLSRTGDRLVLAADVSAFERVSR